MSMTKKEQAQLAELQINLRDALALSWPQEPEPEPMSVEEIKAHCDGYAKPATGWFMNDYLGSHMGIIHNIQHGCSNGHQHSTRSTTKTDSQHCGRMYRTRAEALLAMRWGITRKVARILGEIDTARQQEREQAKPAPESEVAK